MAATAQNHMEPLRSGEGKKDEDREEERTYSRDLGHEMVIVGCTAYECGQS